MGKIGTKNSAGGSKEQKKESVYRQLGKILEAAGVKVRREKLRQGPGWRAHSGACMADKTPMIFVDSRLTVDDQVNFLVGEIRERKVKPSDESMAALPETVQRLILAEASPVTEMAA
jgi:hypothetical protein